MNPTNKSINTTAGLFVGGETDFDVSFSESDAGEISLSVANVGNNMAYSVKVSVPDQDDYKVSGSSSTIVGNLEKGDYTIASFNVASSQSCSESLSELIQNPVIKEKMQLLLPWIQSTESPD